MAAVVSKNLYELLGNDHSEDSDREPEPPVKVVDKTPARTDKRTAPRQAPAGNPTTRRGPGGNEGAFRDKAAGSAINRTKATDDGARPPRSSGGRGGREGKERGHGPKFNSQDRHSRNPGTNSEKQEAHGWGATEGKAELADEIAGEAIAKTDEKDALVGDATKADEAVLTNETEPEPEDNSISYADYLVQLAEKKLALNAAVPEVRKPNEGTKDDKKWANAKALTKEEEEEFIAGSGGKAKRERERKAKNVIEIDQRFVEAPERTSRDSARGGRGGRGDRGDRGDGPRRGGPTNRGPRGDGNFRGPRGDGAPRGRGGPRGGAARGAPRGGAAPINTADKNAFPSLGSA